MNDDRVRELLEAATPGPWDTQREEEWDEVRAKTIDWGLHLLPMDKDEVREHSDADVTLMAAAPGLAQALLDRGAELTELRLTLAAEQGKAEGAPDGWTNHGTQWAHSVADGRANTLVFPMSRPLWAWRSYDTGQTASAPTARAAMQAADKA